MKRGLEGKIPHKLLDDLLARLTKPGREVLIGPSVGEDAFAVGVGRTVVVGSSDPVTFTSEHIGYYAVNVNANDVATMGARPRWFMATVLVPPGTRKRVLASLFEEIDETCVELGIRLCGGHTEATSTVTRPIVVGAMLGTVPKARLVQPQRSRRGDILLMTKRLAIEGTAIIARDKRREVERILGKRGAAKARDLLFSPGISVVREALLAVNKSPVHAMHDPTEGGLLWGLREMSMATGTGIAVDLDRVPVYEETRLLCKHFKLNPYGLIASGSLLVVLSRRSVPQARRAITSAGIECTEIGRLCGTKLALLSRDKPVKFPRLKSDEITKVI